MSKLIKSDQCIEAHPCRLEPIDVDAFFINNEFSENETGPTSEESLPDPDEINSGTAAGLNQMEGEGIIDISRISDFAEQLKAYIEGGQEQAVTTEVVKERVQPPQDDGIADFREVMEKAQREAEKNFSGAKSEADQLTQNAKILADELAKSAKSQAEELTYSAKAQADSILEGAKNKFNELTEGAKQQASSILEGAQRQAGDITYSASRQAEQIISEARQKAELITESANRKAAEILAQTQQQSEVTIKNAEQKAAGLLEAAQRQTEEMLMNAKEQAVEIKTRAGQEGYEAGHAEGLAKAKQEYEKKLSEALTIVAQAEEARLSRIQSSEAELLKLAVAIAEKIIGAELKTDPQTQVAIVKQALTGIPTAGNLTIKVNPEDYRFIEENLAEFQKVFSEPVPVKIQRDQGVEIGNCYIETDHGNIDARIKTQLDMIMAEILKMGRPECA